MLDQCILDSETSNAWSSYKGEQRTLMGGTPIVPSACILYGGISELPVGRWLSYSLARTHRMRQRFGHMKFEGDCLIAVAI